MPRTSLEESDSDDSAKQVRHKIEFSVIRLCSEYLSKFASWLVRHISNNTHCYRNLCLISTQATTNAAQVVPLQAEEILIAYARPSKFLSNIPVHWVLAWITSRKMLAL